MHTKLWWVWIFVDGDEYDEYDDDNDDDDGDCEDDDDSNDDYDDDYEYEYDEYDDDDDDDDSINNDYDLIIEIFCVLSWSESPASMNCARSSSNSCFTLVVIYCLIIQCNDAYFSSVCKMFLLMFHISCHLLPHYPV